MAAAGQDSVHPIMNLMIVQWDNMEDYFAGIIESWDEHPERKSSTAFPFSVCIVWHGSVAEPFV